MACRSSSVSANSNGYRGYQVAGLFELRISECLALKWLDVDWLNARLGINRANVRQHVDETKTSYSRHY